MQHFKLARQAVAYVDFDAILNRQFVGVRFLAQLEDAVLHGGEPARFWILAELARLAGCGALGQLMQHVQLRLSLTAPFGQ